MPEGRINLEEGLSDSPQVRAEVGKLEKFLPQFKEYATLLRDTFQVCSIHQEKVCEGTDALAKLLNSFQEETIGEQDTFIPKAFFRLSRYLSELNSCQEMLSTQLQNAVIELLSQFISTDFSNLEKLRENYRTASSDHEQAAAKFSRYSKKKDTEKARFEANAELFSARKKFYESSLDYYSELNCFQHKKKFAVVEPLLTFMHAQMAYFKVGHEILGNELANLLTGLNTEVQKVHKDYQDELLTTTHTRADIELRFHSLCLPDPDPSDPFSDQPLVPNTGLQNKAGYLFVRVQSGFPSKWDRAYFYTKKGYLYIHTPPKAPELIINLKGAEATVTDVDDRRYAFIVNHSSLKRPIYLMAESDIEKDEWISTVNNIGYDSGHAQPRSNTKRDEAVIKLEREKIRSWVNKEIDPKKTSLPKIPKASPAPTPSTSASQLPTFPSLSNFLNFLDPTSQSNQSDNPPQKKSPTFQRRSSSNPKPTETSTSGDVGAITSPQPKDLPAPLQPERLTTGTASSSPRHHGYSKTFYVKYLGHMEVSEGRNIALITDTIQKVINARVSRNVKDAQAIEMTVTNKSICLYDHSAKKAIGQIVLRDILRCAVQPDSVKLFGIVNRTTGSDDKIKFICHVMEANTTGSQVCSAINEAIQSAIRMIQAKHGRSKSSNMIPVQRARNHKGAASPSGDATGYVVVSSESTDLPAAKQTPPTKSSNMSTIKPPSMKTKSSSDSSLFSGGKVPHPNSTTSSQSSLNSTASDDSADTGLGHSPSGYLPNPLLPTTMQPSMPSLPEHHATKPGEFSTSSSQHTFAVNGGSTFNSTPTPSKPPTAGLAAVAAASSDYYQMPGSLDTAGSHASSDDGDMDSPLPSLDDSMLSSDLSNQFGGNERQSGVAGSASVDSGYFQMPSVHTADTSSQPTPGGSGFGDSGSSHMPLPGPSITSMFGGSGSVDSGSSHLPASVPSISSMFGGSGSVDSGSSHLASNGGITSAPVDSGSAYLSMPSASNDAMGGAFKTEDSFTELSSSDAIFNVSSSQPPVDAMFGGGVANSAAASSTNSGYLPAPESVHPLPNQSAELPGNMNVSSSSANGFPGNFPGMEEDLDDFDLPPLPDSVDPPVQVGVPGSYGGSIVALGTPGGYRN